jgi:hypothetical protein
MSSLDGAHTNRFGFALGKRIQAQLSTAKEQRVPLPACLFEPCFAKIAFSNEAPSYVHHEGKHNERSGALLGWNITRQHFPWTPVGPPPVQQQNIEGFIGVKE